MCVARDPLYFCVTCQRVLHASQVQHMRHVITCWLDGKVAIVWHTVVRWPVERV